MEAHARQFAEIDVCPRCGGAFFDAGEGVAVHGPAAEPRWLIEDGEAVRQGRAEIRCPAHAVETAGDYRDAPRSLPSGDAPWMDLYLIGDGEAAVEVDLCPTCGGFFLDPGEGLALLDLAGGLEEAIVTQSGARLAAPPTDTHVRTVESARHRSAFKQLMLGVFDGVLSDHRRRRLGLAGGPLGAFDD